MSNLILDVDDYILNAIVELPTGDSVQIRTLFFIDETNISDEMAKQSARLTWLNTIYADAKEEYELAQPRTKQIYGEIWDEELSLAATKPTDKTLDAFVRTNAKYVKAVKHEAHCSRNETLMKGIVTSMYQRGEMIRSLGSHVRWEYEQTDIATRIDRAKRGD